MLTDVEKMRKQMEDEIRAQMMQNQIALNNADGGFEQQVCM